MMMILPQCCGREIFNQQKPHCNKLFNSGPMETDPGLSPMQMPPFAEVEFLVVLKPGLEPEACEGSTVTVDLLPPYTLMPGASEIAKEFIVGLGVETAAYWNLSSKWCG